MAETQEAKVRDGRILLKSGTNEVELLEFTLGGQSFGVNVVKVQAIEQYDPARLTKLPMSPASLAGMLLFREKTVPLLDSRCGLGIPSAVELADRSCATDPLARARTQVVLIQEFNNMTTGFLVDGVCQIHRVSWADVHALAPMMSDAPFTGSIHIDEREILIVDMERVVADVFPQSLREHLPSSKELVDHKKAAERGAVLVLLAEDSSVIRRLLQDLLSREGYSRIQAYADGQAAYDAICSLASSRSAATADGELLDEKAILVTDIEMPCMDGLALCRNVKKVLKLTGLPVVMFSSLINEQMEAKCRSVGADAYLSKPAFGKLICILDRLCLS